MCLIKSHVIVFVYGKNYVTIVMTEINILTENLQTVSEKKWIIIISKTIL